MKKNNPNWFVLNMLLVYAVWKLFAWYATTSVGVVHQHWLNAIVSLGTVYAGFTSFILNLFNENTTHAGVAVLYPILKKQIMVEGHCLAIPATIIFIGTILLFKGEWKNKLWFVPLGVLLIVLINMVRLCLLCYTFAHFSQQFFDINHSVVYVVATYSLIFLMIVWWMKKFAGE